ncbi:MAG TPA: 50S ribosomal protein L6 [Acidobacteriota bacterium]|nr:50S ribosomal protein L6 [Acidobacteriota bacterium]
MSRIGKKPITLPEGTSVVSIVETEVVVKGPKGQLTSPLMPGISVKQEGAGTLIVDRANEEKQTRAYHGLCRSLLNNAVVGVSAGFKKQLEIQGIGYRAAVKDMALELQLGYSHPIIYPIPEGISISVEKNTLITVEGIDKQQVGQVAAEIRAMRPPEVYKGKGIRYVGEYVRRKVGKAAVGVS